ncbi:MAG: hypothetical protein ACRESU_10400 [Gammaproteobacteria bacterium]
MQKSLFLLIPFLMAGCVTQPKQLDATTNVVQQKIAPSLIDVAQKLSAGIDPATFATGDVRVDAAGRIQVYVHVQNLTPDMLAALVGHGLEEALPSPPLHVVQGWVLPQNLDEIAALPFVARISPPQYGYPR